MVKNSVLLGLVLSMLPSLSGEDAFPVGSELYVKRKMMGGLSYHHAGVYVGNGEVVHVFAEPRGATLNLITGKSMVHVVKSKFDKFADGDQVKLGPTKAKFSPEKILKRANEMAGKSWKYDPLKHNCQHFSSDMVSGTPKSPEAKEINQGMSQVATNLKKGVETAWEKTEVAAKIGGNVVEKGVKKTGEFIGDTGKVVGGAVKDTGNAAGKAVNKTGKAIKKLFSDPDLKNQIKMQKLN